MTRFAAAWSDKAFRNSGAKLKLKLLKTMPAKGYDEDSRSYSQNLDDLQGGPAFALIRESGEDCGDAFLHEPPSEATAERGFSVTGRGPCITAAFAHQIGTPWACGTTAMSGARRRGRRPSAQQEPRGGRRLPLSPPSAGRLAE